MLLFRKCIRLNKDCYYPHKPREAAVLEDLDRDSLVSIIQQLERRLSRRRQTPDEYVQVSFPTSFFLDPEFLVPIEHSALYSRQPVPTIILEYIQNDVTSLCQQYFFTVHQWFPFISKKRLLERVGHIQGSPDADLALLLLCMKLISTPPEENASRSSAYLSARSLQTSLEGAGAVPLSVLQAIALLALYEIGHGILPAGYLTLGQAARIGVMMGLHCTQVATKLFQPPDTWTLREEQRRTWWAIIILERYINLGPAGLALATPEPCQGDLLPIDDCEWNKGAIGKNEPLYTTGFSVLNLSLFARTAQAAHVLGRVLYHRTDRSQQDRLNRLKEALQLHTTLSALENYITQAQQSIPEEVLPCPIDLALCCSARMTLYDKYGCNEPDELQYGSPSRFPEESEMQAISLDHLQKVVSGQVLNLARAVLQVGVEGVELMSPMLIESIYHAATECQWFIREGIGHTMERAHKLFAEALGILSRRWKLAGKFLHIIFLNLDMQTDVFKGCIWSFLRTRLPLTSSYNCSSDGRYIRGTALHCHQPSSNISFIFSPNIPGS